MAARSSAATASGQRELVITRVFDAPRELVFKAWTDPQHIARWWGPEGFTLPSCAIDLRPGGAYHFHMRARDGTDHWLQGIYHEVVEPERIVCTFTWADAAGKPSRPETLLTVIFAEHGAKTTLTLHQIEFESDTARDKHRHGWNSSLQCLAEHLAVLRTE
jgi:uncharacterized protein YndB with AHSA1/START domain